MPELLVQERIRNMLRRWVGPLDEDRCEECGAEEAFWTHIPCTGLYHYLYKEVNWPGPGRGYVFHTQYV